MPREKAGSDFKKPIAGRIQGIITEHAGTNTAFGKRVDGQSTAGFRYSTVRKWVPEPAWWSWLPQDGKWVPTHEGKARSKERRQLDWNEVQIPNAETLYHFCEFTGASADYVLFGGSSPYRGQSRDTHNLELDLVVAAFRGIAAREVALPKRRLADLWLIPSHLVEFVVETLHSELVQWNEYFEEMESLSQGITRVALRQDSIGHTQPKIAKNLATARRQLHSLANRLVPKTRIIQGVQLVSPETVEGTPDNALLGYYGVVPKGAVVLDGTPELGR
jgi:hypothetical protein